MCAERALRNTVKNRQETTNAVRQTQRNTNPPCLGSVAQVAMQRQSGMILV